MFFVHPPPPTGRGRGLACVPSITTFSRLWRAIIWTPPTATGHQYLDESILEGSRLDIRQEHFQKITYESFVLGSFWRDHEISSLNMVSWSGLNLFGLKSLSPAASSRTWSLCKGKCIETVHCRRDFLHLKSYIYIQWEMDWNSPPQARKFSQFQGTIKGNLPCKMSAVDEILAISGFTWKNRLSSTKPVFFGINLEINVDKRQVISLTLI